MSINKSDKQFNSNYSEIDHFSSKNNFNSYREISIYESEARFRILFDYSPVGMALVSLEGKWLEVNKSVCKLFGYTESEIITKTFQDLTHPADLKKDIEYGRKLLAGELETYQLEKRYFHKNGYMVWGLLSVYLIRDRDNKPLYFISQIADITKLKETEEKLSEKNQELEISNKNLENFAFIASHDLQEPLYSLGKYLEKLSGNYDLDTEQNNLVRTSFTVIKRMKDLISDLLNYSTASKQKVIKNVDCNKVIKKILQSNLKAIIEERKVKITYDSLPTIKADPVKIEQVFQNIISNSIKYCDIQPEISITASYDDGYWLFSFQDNGIGIEKGHQEKVFEIFRRLHNNDKYPGTGIGLAICKKIIEFYGGNIWIESDKNNGSNFLFTFPA